jgi:hypothetical protein
MIGVNACQLLYIPYRRDIWRDDSLIDWSDWWVKPTDISCSPQIYKH